MLVDLFARIDNFIMRLEYYKDIPPTNAMSDIVVKIIVEVISILSIATAEIKQRRSERIASNLSFLSHISVGRYLNRLLGKKRYRSRTKKVGYAHSGGGSDGNRGSLEGHTQHGRQNLPVY